jgi:hypothetical protein
MTMNREEHEDRQGPPPEVEGEIRDGQLQELREYLMKEGQRVQREITEYAHMSQAATKSTKIIAENLAQWNQTAETGT